jgi:hypothetical protein
MQLEYDSEWMVACGGFDMKWLRALLYEYWYLTFRLNEPPLGAEVNPLLSAAS